MKILNIILGIMFLVFAYLQFNDPDPIHWILIYTALATVCFLAAFGYYFKPVLIGLIVILAAYSVVFLPGLKEWIIRDNKAELFDEIAKMEHSYIEESREFLGLMICIGVLALYLVKATKVKSRI